MQQSLPQLHARIESLRDLRDVVGALRAMAATHVQQAQAALVGMRRYVEVVEDAIAEGAALMRELPDDAAPGPAGGRALIAVCTEHGFAGAFNEKVLDRAAADLAPDQRLVVIGRRGAALAAERGLDVDRSFPMATHVGGVLGVTRQVADYLEAMAAADVAFGAYRKGGAFEVVARRVLPLPRELLARSARRPPPLRHLAPAALLQRLASEYLFAEITRSVMESFASENDARLRVMEAADHNIGDKLDVLRRDALSMRQEAITSELLDVVTGSEAVLGG